MLSLLLLPGRLPTRRPEFTKNTSFVNNLFTIKFSQTP